MEDNETFHPRTMDYPAPFADETQEERKRKIKKTRKRKKRIIGWAVGLATLLGAGTIGLNSYFGSETVQLQYASREKSPYPQKAESKYVTNNGFALGPEDGNYAIVSRRVEVPLEQPINFLNGREYFNGKVPYPIIFNHLSLEFNHGITGELEITCKRKNSPQEYYNTRAVVFALPQTDSRIEYKLGYITLGNEKRTKCTFDLTEAVRNLGNIRAIKIMNLESGDLLIDSVREIEN